MIHILHHIYPLEKCLEIAKLQETRINKNISENFNYIKKTVSLDEHELHTLSQFINETVDSLNDSDVVLYIHTKNCTKFKGDDDGWREYMESELIDGYTTHINALNMGFDTSGVLMGIPIFSEYFYPGNFWWARVDSLKKIPKNYPWDFSMNGRPASENNFLQLIPNWRPYSNPLINSESLKKVRMLIRSHIINKEID